MTKCNTDASKFTGPVQRKIVSRFKDGRLTPDARILLLRQVDKQLILIDSINKCA